MFNNVGDAAGRSESKISKAGRGLAAVGKVAARGLAIGVGAASVAMVKFVGDARESERITRITASQIKATGGAANVTAKQVADLSTSISNKTGIDDEAIQANANLLLSFRNIRNEVGKGNDIFNQATAVTQDLATVMETDSKSAALQLGKALNDPIKGVSALGRAGVQFTDQQKEQIKTLVESGRTLDAQKLIMAELAGQVGGAAAAAGDPIDKLRTIVGNLGETIGTAVLPYVNRVATAIGGFVSEMIEGQGAGGRFRDIMSRVGDVVGAVGKWITGTALPALRQFAGFVRAEVLPRLQEFARFITGTVAPVVGRVLTGALAGARSALASIRAAVERNRPTLESMLETFRQVANFVLTKVVPVLGPILRAALTQIGRNIAITVDAVSLLWKVFQTAARIIQGTIERILAVVRIGRQMYQAGRDLVLGFINGIKSLAGAALSAAQDLASDALNAAKSKLKIFSPSRETIKLGSQFSEGLALGVKRKAKDAVNAADELARQIIKAGRKAELGDMTKRERRKEPVRSRLEQILGRRNDRAERQAGEVAARFEAQIESVRGQFETMVSTAASARDAAASALQDIQSRAQSAFTSVSGAISGVFDVSSLGEGDVLTTVRGWVSDARQFVSSIKGLAGSLPPALIQQIAALGPTAGLKVAQAFEQLDLAGMTEVGSAFGELQSLATEGGTIAMNLVVPPAVLAAQESQVAALTLAATNVQVQGEAAVRALEVQRDIQLAQIEAARAQQEQLLQRAIDALSQERVAVLEKRGGEVIVRIVKETVDKESRDLATSVRNGRRR